MCVSASADGQSDSGRCSLCGVSRVHGRPKASVAVDWPVGSPSTGVRAMKVARSVAEILSRHTTLTLECIDRLYLNVYVPVLQRAAGASAPRDRHGCLASWSCREPKHIVNPVNPAACESGAKFVARSIEPGMVDSAPGSAAPVLVDDLSIAVDSKLRFRRTGGPACGHPGSADPISKVTVPHGERRDREPADSLEVPNRVAYCGGGLDRAVQDAVGATSRDSRRGSSRDATNRGVRYIGASSRTWPDRLR